MKKGEMAFSCIDSFNLSGELPSPLASAISSLAGGRVRHMLFPVAFGLFCLSGILTEVDCGIGESSLIDGIEVMLQIAVLGMLFLKIVSQRYSVGAILVIAASTGIVTVSALNAGSFMLLWMLLFIVAAQGESLNSMLRAAVPVFVVSACAICALSIVGVLPNEILPDARAVRYSLGFKHPNMLAKHLTFIAIGLLVLHVDSLKVRNVILPTAIVFVSYQITASRTFAGIGVFAVALVACVSVWGKGREGSRYEKAFGSVRVALCLVLLALSVASMFWFDRSLPAFAWVNSLLSERLHLAHEFCLAYPPTLWGNHQDAMVLNDVLARGGQLPFLVDNAYAHLILTFGGIAACLFIVVYVVVLWRGSRGASTAVLIGLVACAVVGIGESCMLDCRFNPYFVIACAGLLYPRYIEGTDGE